MYGLGFYALEYSGSCCCLHSRYNCCDSCPALWKSGGCLLCCNVRSPVCSDLLVYCPHRAVDSKNVEGRERAMEQQIIHHEKHSFYIGCLTSRFRAYTNILHSNKYIDTEVRRCDHPTSYRTEEEKSYLLFSCVRHFVHLAGLHLRVFRYLVSTRRY